MACCIEAAELELQPALQQLLLRAAAYGKCYLPSAPSPPPPSSAAERGGRGGGGASAASAAVRPQSARTRTRTPTLTNPNLNPNPNPNPTPSPSPSPTPTPYPGGPRARLALVHLLARLLHGSRRSLEPCLPVMLDTLCGAMRDP